MFKDIADAIREKGATGTMTPLEMPSKLSSIPSGGGAKFGVPIEALTGAVDDNGVLQHPTLSNYTFESTEIRGIADYVLSYFVMKDTSITAVRLPNLTTVGVESLYEACYMCTNIHTVDLSGLTTIGEKGMNYCFYGCTSLTELDLSNVTSVGKMGLSAAFNGCILLQSIDLSNVTSVEQAGISSAFYGCTSLRTADLSGMTIGYGLGNTFYNCSSLTSVDVSGIQEVQTAGLSGTFVNCTSLPTLNLSNVTSVGNQGLKNVCYGCTSLKTVNLSSLTTVIDNGMQYSFDSFVSWNLIRAFFTSHTHDGIRKQSVGPIYFKFHNVRMKRFQNLHLQYTKLFRI